MHIKYDRKKTHFTLYIFIWNSDENDEHELP